MNRPKTIKASVVTAILLGSFLFSIAMVPTTSALFNVSSLVTVQWSGTNASKPIVPRGELRSLELTVSYLTQRGNFFGKGLVAAYTGRPVTVDLRIISTPTWCSASISQGTFSFTIQDSLTPQTQKTPLSLTIDEDAPAFGLGSIILEATAHKAGLIDGYTAQFTLDFIPDYKPLIDVSLPDTNTKEIGPMDTATFRINIQNLGNAATKVLLQVVDVPKDWTAVVTNEVLLAEGSTGTATGYLVIKAPKGIGYHYDEKTITISVQPVKADDTSKKGDLQYVSFLVQSRGFSTPGFEPIIFIGALGLVLLIFKVTRKKK